MKTLTLALLLLLGLLQYRLWAGDGSLPDLWRLEDAIQAQRQENNALTERNALLQAEVIDLKEGLDAIEEHARRDLGMIRSDETFYLLVEE